MSECPSIRTSTSACFVSSTPLTVYSIKKKLCICFVHELIWGLSCKPNIYVSWSTSELRVRLAPLNRFSPSVIYCTDRSKAVLLLWTFYVFVLSCVCYVFVCVCLYVHCGHLLWKGWPLGSRLWCLTVSLSLSHWYPGSGVVLDCIDSWSLHPYLLCMWFGHSSIFPLMDCRQTDTHARTSSHSKSTGR